uniref:Uncharacterized protein n=1 Tax=Arundo donax TaxID=35708 RepID=A0A0A8ZX64_ARUDO
MFEIFHLTFKFLLPIKVSVRRSKCIISRGSRYSN